MTVSQVQGLPYVDGYGPAARTFLSPVTWLVVPSLGSVSQLVMVVLGLGCALGVGGLVALAVVAMVRANQREQRRRAELIGWAGARGWTANWDHARAGWMSRLPGRGRLGLLLTGAYRGRPACAADYSYTTTSSNGDGSTTSSTHHYCAFVTRTRRRYPALLVTSRGSGSKLWRHLTGPGRTELGHPAFDEHYKIVTSDPATAHRLLGPALVQAHLSGHLPDWHLHDQDLLAYHPGRLSPVQLEAGLARIAAVADLIEPPG